MPHSITDDDDDNFRLRMANRKRLMELFDEASRRIDEIGGIPHDEFWTQIDAKYEKNSNRRHKRKAGK